MKTKKEAHFVNFKEYLEKIILKCNRSVLSVLASCEKEASIATTTERNLHVFDILRI